MSHNLLEHTKVVMFQPGVSDFVGHNAVGIIDQVAGACPSGCPHDLTRNAPRD